MDMKFSTLLALVLTILSVSLVEVIQADVSTLSLVHVVWRHGDRTPENTPPKIPNYWDKWEEPRREITQIGLLQQYNLGCYIRKRYSGFISDTYSPFELYVRSSDYNRTIMSALANLAGLFPVKATTDPLLAPDLLWRPIPVHVVPRPVDNFLVLTETCPCPSAENELARVQQSAIALKTWSTYSDVIRLSVEKTGFSCDVINDCWKVHDMLKTERCHNLPWPDWATEELFNKFTTIQETSFAVRFTTPMLRLRGSTLFDDIVKRIEARINGKLDHRLKYYAFSGHDFPIYALLKILGADVKEIPPYASALFIELHEQNGNYFVEVHYRKGPTGETKHLRLTNCENSERCSLEHLKKLSKIYVPEDWELECGLKPSVEAEAYLSGVDFKVATGVLGALLVLLVLAAIFQWRLLRQLRQKLENELPAFATWSIPTKARVVQINN